MSRNLISDEIAAANRGDTLDIYEKVAPPGGYTFNAYPPDDYEGFILVVACVRLGDHAHLDVETGRQIIAGNDRPQIHRGNAGKLILPWQDWLTLRTGLDELPWTRIAEVERPTSGQLDRHT